MWRKILILVWTAQITIHYCVWYDLNFVATLIWSALSLLGVIVIIFVDLSYMRRSKWSVKPVGIISIISLYILAVLTPYGSEIGASIKLYRLESDYLRIVKSVLEGNRNECYWPECKIERGPPVRIAFSWGGFGDNWIGICYDPSGAISNANDHPESPVRSLFGGDLISGYHLWRNWYLCGFT